MQELLSPDELARAARLRFPEKARDFVASRVRLRQILARYLDYAPAEIPFVYGPHGKPALAGADLHFNLAHSGAWMLLAAASRPIGIDLERIDPCLDYAALARHYFSPAEQERLNPIPACRRRRAFYRLWTRKEAFLKGRGEGFSRDAGNVSASGWQVRNFFVGRGYVGAMAAADTGDIKIVRRWTWGA